MNNEVIEGFVATLRAYGEIPDMDGSCLADMLAAAALIESLAEESETSRKAMPTNSIVVCGHGEVYTYGELHGESAASRRRVDEVVRKLMRRR